MTARADSAPSSPASALESPRASDGFAGAISGVLASDGGAPAPRRPAVRTASWGEVPEGGRGPPPSLSSPYDAVLRDRRIVIGECGGESVMALVDRHEVQIADRRRIDGGPDGGKAGTGDGAGWQAHPSVC